jgi:hypothetical protein
MASLDGVAKGQGQCKDSFRDGTRIVPQVICEKAVCVGGNRQLSPV